MRCFTIGHSTFKIETFLERLDSSSVNCVVDVRSVPFSAYSPQYNQDLLKKSLNIKNISYVYLGDLLGARHVSLNLLFANGQVDFAKVSRSPSFISGLDRIIKGVRKGYNIALMCSEKNPLDCHRFVLVSRALSRAGVIIEHITPNGKITNSDLELQLLDKFKLNQSIADLFEPEPSFEEKLNKAYHLSNLEIAYNAKTKEGDE